MENPEILIENQIMLKKVLRQALEGQNAHLRPMKALEGLRLNSTGQKVLNSPYTIWQLLKHMNYWQIRFLNRLEGKEDFKLACNWVEGWENKQNAESQQELEQEIDTLNEGIEKAFSLLEQDIDNSIRDESYQNKYDVVQAMASHLSYHLAEVILLRRIFGSWIGPGESGFYGSFR